METQALSDQHKEAVIQLIDWLATVAYLATGDVTLRQVATASLVPLLFAVALAWLRPRRGSRVTVQGGGQAAAAGPDTTTT